MLDRFATVLERRFLLVSFLPMTLFLGALTLVYLASTNEVEEALDRWADLAGSAQLVLGVAAFCVTWMLAGFLDAQLRNLTQVFEGYLIPRVFGRYVRSAREWHLARYDDLSGYAVGDAKPQSDEGPGQARETVLPAGEENREDLFVLYPADPEHVMPTQLGNIIRAAEEYSMTRYHADYLLVWPRLAHLCSDRFVVDYETVRASLDFMIVVASLGAIFAIAGGSIVVVFGHSIPLFIAVTLIGAAAAAIGYRSALTAAIEYGEQMRASVDLYRSDLLRQLGYPLTSSIAVEQRYWEDFEATLRQGVPRQVPYHPPPTADDEGRSAGANN